MKSYIINVTFHLDGTKAARVTRIGEKNRYRYHPRLTGASAFRLAKFVNGAASEDRARLCAWSDGWGAYSVGKEG